MRLPRVARTRVAVSLAAATALAAVAPPASAGGGVDVPHLLAGGVERVNARGLVPVLLPDRLPISAPRAHGRGGPTKYGYLFQVEADRRCAGEAECTRAYLVAERGALRSPGVRVKLPRGRVGRYLASTCSRSCTPSQVSWQERGATYTIAASVGTARATRTALVRMAGEAILAGPRG